ncbi:hypothetical protein BGZ80_007843 [Entomortierella chlamydospora]|uniref:GST C-terminal domain-containing protein n=1 Tax=Entomortierella chlamydospora TaxID=101097 RepID=A0A9P6T4E0_9FUNG|nr:hypothetical protein BGZ80_007843 [Entomortierella chlamydospora]
MSLADLSQATDNVHNIVYFPFHGLAGCIRTILILSDEPHKFTNLGFPVLELAEISAIEHFLAKRGNLLGKDYWEENLIKMYLSSTHALFTFLVHNVVQSPKEDRPAFLERFKKSNLPEWIKFHEKHLKENGSNGHYVGDQLSIADIKTASVIDHLINLCGEDVHISEELTPAIMAVKNNLEKNPKYAEWRASEQYQKFTTSNAGFFGF